MSFDFDDLVEKHFKEKKDVFGFENIASLIEEAIDEGLRTKVSTLFEDIERPSVTFNWSMIPDIPISEIGWSEVSEDPEGKRILGPQRTLLERYLKNIQSEDGTFAGQIRALQRFYSPEGPKELMTQYETNSQRISALISYLVFYKTLTKVVTNFNASSAGFNFEAFLAVLLKGKQIPPGNATIADFLTGDDIPISLKLYTKLKVGGSWGDLVRDIIEPKFSHPVQNGHAMRYVAGIKKLSEAGDPGERLRQEGDILLYQFDITLDNIVNIMLDSMHPGVVALPKSLIDRGQNIAAELPTREKIPTNEELENIFIDKIKEYVKTVQMPPALKEVDSNFPDWNFLGTVLQDVAYGQLRRAEGEGSIFNTWRGLGFTTMPLRSGFSSPVLLKVLYPHFIKMYGESEALPRYRGEVRQKIVIDMLKPLSAIIAKANNDIVSSLEASEVATRRAEMLDTVEFEFDKERLKVYYENLSMEEKMVALQNTYGYITDKQRQWDLNETQATNTGYPTFTAELGNIKVGGRYVEEMLEYVTAALDDEIFQVFSSLKTLSDSLNGYFAGGLSDDDDYMAADAIASAQDIEKRTKETRNPESIK
tara:strand:- start:3119 stop:4897 length:1779 start_codon:yes stop_codon:yes gene_type:complete